jgi:hypothetical protein
MNRLPERGTGGKDTLTRRALLRGSVVALAVPAATAIVSVAEARDVGETIAATSAGLPDTDNAKPISVSLAAAVAEAAEYHAAHGSLLGWEMSKPRLKECGKSLRWLHGYAARAALDERNSLEKGHGLPATGQATAAHYARLRHYLDTETPPCGDTRRAFLVDTADGESLLCPPSDDLSEEAASERLAAVWLLRSSPLGPAPRFALGEGRRELRDLYDALEEGCLTAAVGTFVCTFKHGVATYDR